MSVRITSQAMSTHVLEDLRTAQAKMARTQQEVSSGKRLLQASDDALGTHDALRLHGALSGIAQDQSSVSDATAWVSATDSAISTLTEIVHRARELTLQGANGSSTPSARATMAKELGQLIETAKDAANAKVGDSYIFGGTATTTPPYQAGAVDTYGGDAGVVRPADDASEAAWFDYVYLRDNPSGPHLELWLHSAGCRSWFKVRRDTRTHDILASSRLGDPLPGAAP